MKNLIFIFILLSVKNPVFSQESTTPINIVPLPYSLEMGKGNYSLSGHIRISVSDPECKSTASFLQGYFLSQGLKASISEKTGENPEIRLSLSDQANTGSEEYHLTISEQGVAIEANENAGLFYGIQTLFQIIAPGMKKIPYLEINDKPRFAYRGMHLDVGRHMFPVDFIKKYIDMMSHFKYNTFHWHLTEDQGWRIEIKQYPKLQEVAAFRKETVVGHASTRTRDQAVYDRKPYGGFYTQEEVKEIVAYAAVRHITVIPEIELPGHSQAALAAYPHLGCTEGPYETATTWGVFDDIYCAGKETTFEFLENVFSEVLPLFPGKYVHIGGDEAPKGQWKKCPNCQKRIKDEGLKDEHELQSYFVQRMEKYLNNKGKTMIGWDEILEGGLAPNAIVMSWRGEEGGIAAAQQNHEVVMTPVSWCYFDYYQADPASEPLAIGGMNTVKKVYGYEPIPAQLTEEQMKYVLGAQCNLWTEYIKTSDYAEYMVYPRAIAMSEVLWSSKNNRDYDDFVHRTKNIRPLLDFWKINYARHIFEE